MDESATDRVRWGAAVADRVPRRGLGGLLNPEFLWWLSCRAYRRRLVWAARLLKLANYLLFRAILPYQAEIERDIALEHYGLGVVIHPNVTLGHGVRIYHHVTLGSETWIGSPHRIRVGDGAMIGAGAVLLCKRERDLAIGAGAVVGANAVVTRDVAPGQTVVGAPARPVERRTNGALVEAGMAAMGGRRGAS